LIARAVGIGRAGPWTIFIADPEDLGIGSPFSLEDFGHQQKIRAGCFRDQACDVECWKNKSRGRNTSGPVEVESFPAGLRWRGFWIRGPHPIRSRARASVRTARTAARAGLLLLAESQSKRARKAPRRWRVAPVIWPDRFPFASQFPCRRPY
jgi:hypothetical protein